MIGRRRSGDRGRGTSDACGDGVAGQPAGSARARRDGRRQDAAGGRRRRGCPAPGGKRGRRRGDHRLRRRRGRALDERYRRRRLHGRPGAGRGAGGRRLPDGGPGGGPAGDVSPQRRRQRYGALRLAGGGRQRQCLGLSLGRRAGDSRGARPGPGALGNDLAGRGAGPGDPLGRGGGSRLLAHHPDDRRRTRHAEAVSRHGGHFPRRRRQSARHPGAGSSPLAASGGPGAHPAHHRQRWPPRDVRGVARADHRRRSRRQRRSLHP